MDEWISVSDRLPEDDEPVLIYYGFPGYNMIIGLAWYNANDPDGVYTWCWEWDDEPITEQTVTHWMPLPDAP